MLHSLFRGSLLTTGGAQTARNVELPHSFSKENVTHGVTANLALDISTISEPHSFPKENVTHGVTANLAGDISTMQNIKSYLDIYQQWMSLLTTSQ